MASGEEGEPTGPAPVGTAPQYGDVRPVLQKHQPEIRLFRACERQEGVELSGGKRESPMGGGGDGSSLCCQVLSGTGSLAWVSSTLCPCKHGHRGEETHWHHSSVTWDQGAMQ